MTVSSYFYKFFFVVIACLGRLTIEGEGERERDGSKEVPVMIRKGDEDS